MPVLRSRGARHRGGLIRGHTARAPVDTYANGPAIERYREVACLVSDQGAPRGVVIGAAPLASWRRQSPDVERSVLAFLRS